MSPLHVYPTNDLHPHNTEGDECPCMPRIEVVAGGDYIVIHNAWDEREKYEEVGLT